MKVIDLSHPISPTMPVYPSTDSPLFTTTSTLERDGFCEKKIALCSHTGTHIDAPVHIIQGAKTLDCLSIDRFLGKAYSLDLTPIRKKIITLSDLEPYRDVIRSCEFFLLNTGWSLFWGTERYFIDYPVLSSEAALWLGDFQLKGIGVDMISADGPESHDFPIHRIFLSLDILIIENLTNLSALPVKDFLFSCFPLKIEEADGSPVRAVAIIC